MRAWVTRKANALVTPPLVSRPVLQTWGLLPLCSLEWGKAEENTDLRPGSLALLCLKTLVSLRKEHFQLDFVFWNELLLISYYFAQTSVWWVQSVSPVWRIEGDRILRGVMKALVWSKMFWLRPDSFSPLGWWKHENGTEARCCLAGDVLFQERHLQRYYVFGFIRASWCWTSRWSSSVLPWLAGGNAVVDGCSKAQSSAEPAAEEYALMSIDTIINGKVRLSGTCAGSPSRQSL